MCMIFTSYWSYGNTRKNIMDDVSTLKFYSKVQNRNFTFEPQYISNEISTLKGRNEETYPYLEKFKFRGFSYSEIPTQKTHINCHSRMEALFGLRLCIYRSRYATLWPLSSQRKLNYF